MQNVWILGESNKKGTKRQEENTREKNMSLRVPLKLGFSSTYIDIIRTFEKSLEYLQLVFCCSRSHNPRSLWSLWTCRLKTKLVKFLTVTSPRIDRLTTFSGSGASKL